MGCFPILLLFCWVIWHRALAAPLADPEPGVEHIVLINKHHPIPPRITSVLQRLDLTPEHINIKHIYNSTAFTGFSANLQPNHLALLHLMPDLLHIEPVTPITTTNLLIPSSDAFNTRTSAPWGLERISAFTAQVLSTSAANTLNFTYAFGNQNLGQGVDIYILDTGISTSHSVFQPRGRARMLWSYDNDLRDLDGHGTNVAGIAAGKILGVASEANILGLKALSSTGGSTATVMKALDLAVLRHETRKLQSNLTGSVVSMSLAASLNVPSLNHAITSATLAGLHIVVAAGNNAGSACSISPASSGGTHGPAITVGAIDITSSVASFSNTGACVDLYAPGVDVISAWIGGPEEVRALTGTSMAAPHVAGLVAYAMGNSTLAGDVGLMKRYLRETAVGTGNGVLIANNGLGRVGVTDPDCEDT